MGKPIRKDGSYDSLHGKDSIYLLFADSLVVVYIFVKSIEKKVIVFINLQNYKYFAFLIDIIDNNRGKAMYWKCQKYILLYKNLTDLSNFSLNFQTKYK